MRRVMIGDLIAAAAVVATADYAAQPRLAARLISEADAAHRYFKHWRRAHVVWGNGSLLSRALAIQHRAPPNLCDAAFLSVLALVAASAAAHKSYAAAQDKVKGRVLAARLPPVI